MYLEKNKNMGKIQTNPSKFIQRFIDIMSVSHEVEVIYSVRIRQYRKCFVAVCVDRYCYEFFMYDGKNYLRVEKWQINKMLRNEHSYVGWSSFYSGTGSMKQVVEIEKTRHLDTKGLRFDRCYKYQELKTWKLEK